MLNRQLSAVETAEEILRLFIAHRRVLGSVKSCQHEGLLSCFAPHLKKILRYVNSDEQILFVLPAFPAKSPNLKKTAGALPDLGERLALQFLNQICQKIKLFYPPGARILICSDGRVFNDLVKVPDADVDAYAHGIRLILQEDALTHITTFALDDHYKSMPYEQMREELTQDYGEPIAFIKAKVKSDAAAKNLFNGIHRFIYEDQLSLLNGLSKNQIKTITKEMAYRVIQRSNAWSRFVETYFSNAVRLSIHPQLCGSEKLGIMLLRSKDVWATPWHRVVLREGKKHVLVKKMEAEEMGAKPVFEKGQFSHYVLGKVES